MVSIQGAVTIQGAVSIQGNTVYVLAQFIV